MYDNKNDVINEILKIADKSKGASALKRSVEGHFAEQKIS